jgi:hypothetical protein
MKGRVDEILKSGKEWNATAKELTEALNNLTAAIKQGNVPPSTVKPVAASSKVLAVKSARLTRAFETYEVTMKNIMTRIGL